MKRPSFAEGVLVALAAALGAAILHTGLTLLLPLGDSLSLVCVALGFGYLVYLLGRSPANAGRLATVMFWMLGTLLVWVLLPGVWPQVLFQLGLLWLVRSFHFQGTSLAALLDLGLVACGLLAALWAAERTGSLFLAVWSLLLVQAAFVWVAPKPGEDPFVRDDTDPFDAAERAAERALRRLSISD